MVLTVVQQVLIIIAYSKKDLILTAYTPVVEGVDIIQYAENGFINGAMDNIVLLKSNGEKINTKEGISL